MRFILGSSSPARLKVLRTAGLDPQVVVPDVDERSVREKKPRTLVARLAEAKAIAALARTDTSAPGLLLACDSMLEFDGKAVGKPADAADARARWKALRAHRGTLHTGHCLTRLPDGATRTAVASTLVVFADVSDAEIDAYVATGEPLSVAGAFTIDGYGGAFIESIAGDPSNVIGVSLPLLRAMATDLGVAWTDLWSARG